MTRVIFSWSFCISLFISFPTVGSRSSFFLSVFFLFRTRSVRFLIPWDLEFDGALEGISTTFTFLLFSFSSRFEMFLYVFFGRGL